MCDGGQSVINYIISFVKGRWFRIEHCTQNVSDTLMHPFTDRIALRILGGALDTFYVEFFQQQLKIKLKFRAPVMDASDWFWVSAQPCLFELLSNML